MSIGIDKIGFATSQYVLNMAELKRSFEARFFTQDIPSPVSR